MLEIDTDKVCFIIVKAREFEAEDTLVEADDDTNPSDDSLRARLAARAGDPYFEELKRFINDLNWDERCRLVALAWTGRGDYSAEEWDAALAEAERVGNDKTAEYLLGMPLLPDYLEEGLSAFDLSCEDFDKGVL